MPNPCPECGGSGEPLGPQESAVVLHDRQVDALLAMLEAALNAGIEPGVGLRREDAEEAGYLIVGQRFRDQEAYRRAPRIIGTVWWAGEHG